MTKKSSSRRFLVLSLAVVLLAGGSLAVIHFMKGAHAGESPYRTQAVARQRIVATVSASGTISPLKSVQVGSQVSGRVLELMADFNSQVKKGEVIARLDPQLFQADLSRAQANLASARANLTKANAALEEAKRQALRSKALVDRGVLAQADGDTAESTARSAAASRVAASADIVQAQAAVETARTNLALTTIVSPIDGVVISRSVDVGQTVAASLQAPTIFTIAEDMKAMEVHTSVAESDVGVLLEGNPVTFTVDAFPGERFKGTVTQIRNAPTTVQNVVTYDAVVRVSNDDLKLRPGMTANVTFVVAEKKDALAVSSAALRFTPAGMTAPAAGRRGPAGQNGAQNATKTVWVLDGDKPRAVSVQTGVTDGRNTEITGGELPEGALAIVGATSSSGVAAPAQQTQQQGGRGGLGAGGRRGGGFGL